MDVELLLRSNSVALTLLIPGIIAGGLAFYALLKRRVPGSQVFAFAMLSVFIWCIAYAGELSSLKLEGMQFWLSLEYFGVSPLPVLWFILALLYSGREKYVTTRNVMLLFIVPAVIIALVATNQFHHFVYSAMSVDTNGPFPMLSLTRGPGYWVNIVYSYIILILGMILLLTRVRHPHLVYRKQIIAMLAGLLVPWVLNMLYQIFNFVPFQHLDLTPFGFTVTGVVIAWAMYRYQLFNMVPIARGRVLEKMGDGLIVLDSQDRVVDANKSAERILGWASSPIGKPTGAMLARWPDLLELCRSSEAKTTELARTDQKGLNKYYEASTSDLLSDQGNMLGKVVLLHDITDRKRIEDELKENEEKYRTFFKTTRDAVFMTTTDGWWLEVNDAAAKVFGYDGVEDLRKIPVIDVYAIQNQRKEFTDAISAQGFVKDMPVIFRRKNGQLMDCLLTAVAVRDKNGKVTGFQGTVKDITEIKQAQKALMEANEQLHGWLLSAEQRNREIKLLGEMAQSIQSSHDMQAAYQGTAEYMSKLFEGDSGFIAEIDGNNHTVEVKASFGKPEGKMVFSTSDCIALQKMKVHESDGSDASTICPHMGTFSGCCISIPLVNPGGASWLLQLQHGQGDLISSEACQQWLESRRPLVLSVGQELSVALSNIRLRETLHDQAIRDALTGLYNRRYMEEMLDPQLHRARRTGSSIGFIMADLDHFKIFNDSYGHVAGDLLLQAVANRIRNVIRVEDIACRYGGEEFLIILPYASLKDTHTRALQILEEIRDISFLYEGKQLGSMTISMGVSAFPDNGDDASILIRLADNAMYIAKNQGRDRVIIAG